MPLETLYQNPCKKGDTSSTAHRWRFNGLRLASPICSDGESNVEAPRLMPAMGGGGVVSSSSSGTGDGVVAEVTGDKLEKDDDDVALDDGVV